MKRKITVGIFPDPYLKDKWHTEGNQNIRYWADETVAYGYEIVGLSLEQVVDIENLRSLGLDIIHIHWPESIIGSVISAAGWLRKLPLLSFLQKKVLLSRWLSKLEKLNLPFVLQIHDLTNHQNTCMRGLIGHLDMSFRTRLYEISQVVMTQEYSSLVYIEALYGPKMFGVSFLGDFSLFHGSKIDKNAARGHLGLSANDKVFLCIGTARPNRNPKRAIEIFNSLPGSHIKLLVAGMNNLQYEQYAESENIRFLHGMLDNEMMRNLFCAADFLINDAAEYLTSAVLRSAMSYGLPVIAYEYGAAIDMVAEAAIFIEAGPSGLKNAIMKALDLDKAQIGQLIKAAERRNAERNWQQAGSEFHRVYSMLLK